MTNTIAPYNGLAAGYNQAKGSAVSLFKPLDPEKQKEFEQTKAVLQQTLHAMKNSKNDIARQKKAMAQQKLARIKEAIKSMKQMAFADPKAMARMASRLAKELAAAIKEYAAAGATTTEMQAASGGGSPTASGSDPAAAQDANTDAAAADPALAEAQSEMSEATGLAETATSDAQDPTKADEKFQAYEKAQNFGHDRDKEDTGTIKRKDDDSAFIKDAKDVLDELRNLIKSLRAKAGKKPLFGRDDVGEAEKAMREADRAFATLSRTLGGISAASTGTAGIGTSV